MPCSLLDGEHLCRKQGGNVKTPIPFYDFGGNGPLIHFSHSNGFTPACFRLLIEPFLDHYHVVGGCHRPLWPGSRPEDLKGWDMVADDMLRFFEQQSIGEVIGIGHSLGAVATMYASLKRLEIFKKLVLIEPIFLPPVVLQLVAQNPDSMNEIPLIRNTYKRRNRWPDKTAAFEHFRSKEVFAKWSDEALWDYVNHALHEDKSGKSVLTYSREWEVRFYTRPPMDVWQVIPTITHPTLAIRGAESDALFPEAWQLWQELQPQAQFVQFEEVGHMLVMEQPGMVAETILNFLQSN